MSEIDEHKAQESMLSDDSLGEETNSSSVEEDEKRSRRHTHSSSTSSRESERTRLHSNTSRSSHADNTGEFTYESTRSATSAPNNDPSVLNDAETTGNDEYVYDNAGDLGSAREFSYEPPSARTHEDDDDGEPEKLLNYIDDADQVERLGRKPFPDDESSISTTSLFATARREQQAQRQENDRLTRELQRQELERRFGATQQLLAQEHQRSAPLADREQMLRSKNARIPLRPAVVQIREPVVRATNNGADASIPPESRIPSQLLNDEDAAANDHTVYHIDYLEDKTMCYAQTRFRNKQVERSFKRFFSHVQLNNVRLSIVIVLLSNLSFALWDALEYDELKYNLWYLRLVIACIALACLLVTFLRGFRGRVQNAVLCVFLLCAAVSIAITDFFLGKLESYALMMLVMGSYVMMILDFYTLVVLNTLISGMWVLLIVASRQQWIQTSRLPTADLREQLSVNILVNTLPIVFVNFSGAICLYYGYRSIRYTYLRMKTQRHLQRICDQSIRACRNLIESMLPPTLAMRVMDNQTLDGSARLVHESSSMSDAGCASCSGTATMVPAACEGNTATFDDRAVMVVQLHGIEELFSVARGRSSTLAVRQQLGGGGGPMPTSHDSTPRSKLSMDWNPNSSASGTPRRRRVREGFDYGDAMKLLNTILKEIDYLVDCYGAEKIVQYRYTYVCTSNLSLQDPQTPQLMASAALDIRNFVMQLGERLHYDRLGVTIGLYHGQVRAHYEGAARTHLEMWGRAVNKAYLLSMNGCSLHNIHMHSKLAMALSSKHFAVMKNERSDVENIDVSAHGNRSATYFLLHRVSTQVFKPQIYERLELLQPNAENKYTQRLQRVCNATSAGADSSREYMDELVRILKHVCIDEHYDISEYGRAPPGTRAQYERSAPAAFRSSRRNGAKRASIRSDDTLDTIDQAEALQRGTPRTHQEMLSMCTYQRPLYISHIQPISRHADSQQRTRSGFAMLNYGLQRIKRVGRLYGNDDADELGNDSMETAHALRELDSSCDEETRDDVEYWQNRAYDHHASTRHERRRQQFNAAVAEYLYDLDSDDDGAGDPDVDGALRQAHRRQSAGERDFYLRIVAHPERMMQLRAYHMVPMIEQMDGDEDDNAQNAQVYGTHKISVSTPEMHEDFLVGAAEQDDDDDDDDDNSYRMYNSQDWPLTDRVVSLDERYAERDDENDDGVEEAPRRFKMRRSGDTQSTGPGSMRHRRHRHHGHASGAAGSSSGASRRRNRAATKTLGTDGYEFIDIAMQDTMSGARANLRRRHQQSIDDNRYEDGGGGGGDDDDDHEDGSESHRRRSVSYFRRAQLFRQQLANSVLRFRPLRSIAARAERLKQVLRGQHASGVTRLQGGGRDGDFDFLDGVHKRSTFYWVGLQPLADSKLYERRCCRRLVRQAFDDDDEAYLLQDEEPGRSGARRDNSCARHFLVPTLRHIVLRGTELDDYYRHHRTGFLSSLLALFLFYLCVSLIDFYNYTQTAPENGTTHSSLFMTSWLVQYLPPLLFILCTSLVLIRMDRGPVASALSSLCIVLCSTMPVVVAWSYPNSGLDASQSHFDTLQICLLVYTFYLIQFRMTLCVALSVYIHVCYVWSIFVMPYPLHSKTTLGPWAVLFFSVPLALIGAISKCYSTRIIINGYQMLRRCRKLHDDTKKAKDRLNSLLNRAFPRSWIRAMDEEPFQTGRVTTNACVLYMRIYDYESLRVAYDRFHPEHRIQESRRRRDLFFALFKQLDEVVELSGLDKVYSYRGEYLAICRPNDESSSSQTCMKTASECAQAAMRCASDMQTMLHKYHRLFQSYVPNNTVSLSRTVIVLDCDVLVTGVLGAKKMNYGAWGPSIDTCARIVNSLHDRGQAEQRSNLRAASTPASSSSLTMASVYCTDRFEHEAPESEFHTVRQCASNVRVFEQEEEHAISLYEIHTEHNLEQRNEDFSGLRNNNNTKDERFDAALVRDVTFYPTMTHTGSRVIMSANGQLEQIYYEQYADEEHDRVGGDGLY